MRRGKPTPREAQLGRRGGLERRERDQRNGQAEYCLEARLRQTLDGRCHEVCNQSQRRLLQRIQAQNTDAPSLDEAGDRLFTFTRLPPTQWKSARTTNAIERLHGEFKRRIKTQTVLPSADTAAMLFWALLASGQIVLRKIDGWQSLTTKPIAQPIDLAA